MDEAMTREEHIVREETLRDPADAATPREELEAELVKLKATINDAYWTFTRSANGKPPSMQVPEAYARRRAVRAELMHRREDDFTEPPDDDYDESMDGDHESALESVYGPND